MESAEAKMFLEIRRLWQFIKERTSSAITVYAQKKIQKYLDLIFRQKASNRIHTNRTESEL